MILQKEGRDVHAYKTVDDLVETHIRGLLAVRERDGKAILDLLKKYRTPPDISKF